MFHLPKKLLTLVAPLAIVGALFAVPAMASAATLEVEGTPLPAGSPITGFSNNLVFTTAEGNLECAENEVNGTLTSNGGAEATVEIGAARFEGEGVPPCKTTIAGGAVTALISPTGLPWTLTVFEGGLTTITGSPVVDFEAILFFEGTPIAACDYESEVVFDEYTPGAPLGDRITNQEFTLGASEGSCPASGVLNGEFEVTSGGKPVVVTNP